MDPQAAMPVNARTIEPAAGSNVPDSSLELPLQGVAERGPAAGLLDHFRHNFPFVPIYPLPSVCQSIKAADTTTPGDIIVPDLAYLVWFTASAPFWVSNRGAPIPADSSGTSKTQNGTGSLVQSTGDTGFYIPAGTSPIFWCGGTKSFTVIGSAANATITANFINRV